jgi:hypothetical protein
MFQFTGYIFDKRLNYNLIIWVAPVCLLVILHPSSLSLSRKSTKVQTNK